MSPTLYPLNSILTPSADQQFKFSTSFTYPVRPSEKHAFPFFCQRPCPYPYLSPCLCPCPFPAIAVRPPRAPQFRSGQWRSGYLRAIPGLSVVAEFSARFLRVRSNLCGRSAGVPPDKHVSSRLPFGVSDLQFVHPFRWQFRIQTGEKFQVLPR